VQVLVLALQQAQPAEPRAPSEPKACQSLNTQEPQAPVPQARAAISISIQSSQSCDTSIPARPTAETVSGPKNIDLL